jgi:diguanylate cyclase (GGDEF)-like protein/PAS domain S-box-containing protein
MSHNPTVNEPISEKELDTLQMLAGYATDMVYRLRYDTMRYDYISPSAEKLLGFTPDELKKLNFRSLILETRLVTHAMRQVTDFGGLERNRQQGKTLKWQADYRIRTKDGKTLWVADVSYPWFDDAGAMIGSIGTLRDITERVQAEEQHAAELSRTMTIDTQTGLPLRTQFFSRLESELKRQTSQSNEVTVMVITIDHFEKTQRDCSYDQTAQFVQHIAATIQATIRDSHMLARISDDTFALCLSETSLQQAFSLAESVREHIAATEFRTRDGKLYPLTIHVGLSGSQFDEKRHAAELYKTAENRLILAKHSHTSVMAAAAHSGDMVH